MNISLDIFRESAIDKLWNINVFGDDDNIKTEIERDPLLTHHPFDNTCKFPLPNSYAEDIIPFHLSERMRQLKCEVKQKDYATMDSEGYIYVHPHFVDWPRLERDVQCKVDIIEGGLRKPERNMTKNSMFIKKTLEVSDKFQLLIEMRF